MDRSFFVRYIYFPQAAERRINKTNIYSRKLGTSTQALPAITWYPPTEKQSANTKVQKWLNKHTS